MAIGIQKIHSFTPSGRHPLILLFLIHPINHSFKIISMATPDFSQIGGPRMMPANRTGPNRKGLLLCFFWERQALWPYITGIKWPFSNRSNPEYAISRFFAGCLAGFVFLFTSKDVRTAVFFLFKTLMRKITGTIIKLDPIAIMKIYIDDLKEKREKMQGQINILAGQLVKLNKKINENNEKIKQKFAEANKATELSTIRECRKRLSWQLLKAQVCRK